MGFDLFGQIFGKARRRAIEAQVAGELKAGDVKPAAINWQVLGSRLAAAGAAYLVSAVVKGDIPRDTRSAALVGAGALGAVVMAAPSAFQAAGILSAISPETVSLAKAVSQAVTGLANAPAAARQQAVAAQEQAIKEQMAALATQAAETALANWQTRTGSFSADQLAGKAPLPPGMAVSDTPETSLKEDYLKETPLPVVTPSADAATLVTGGNQ